MRALKVLLAGIVAALAALAGLFVVGLLIVLTVLGLAARGRWRRRHRPPPPTGPRRTGSDDVIEVTATEVTSRRPDS